MPKDFREFVMRGNVLDLAVAFIMGAAFGQIISSLVNDILMPPIGLLLGRIDFSNLFVSLSGEHYNSLAQAKAAGAPTINYGVFINGVINFLIVAFVLFLLVRQVARMRRKQEALAAAPPPTTKECQYCFTSIPIKARRCPNCTSELAAAK